MNRDSTARVDVSNDGVLCLSGRVGYANAGKLLSTSRRALSEVKLSRVDLGQLKDCDSATLALLLALAADAAQAKRGLVMSGAPVGLRALARLANVEKLLQLA